MYVYIYIHIYTVCVCTASPIASPAHMRWATFPRDTSASMPPSCLA